MGRIAGRPFAGSAPHEPDRSLYHSVLSCDIRRESCIVMSSLDCLVSCLRVVCTRPYVVIYCALHIGSLRLRGTKRMLLIVSRRAPSTEQEQPMEQPPQPHARGMPALYGDSSSREGVLLFARV